MLVEVLVKEDWHFLQLVLSIISYKFKRELLNYVDLNKLKQHVRSLNSIFYIRIYNKHTYNSRRIKNNLPPITSYYFIVVGDDYLPQQFINFLKCYYRQPYPPIKLMPAEHIKRTNVLFEYYGNTVVYIPERRSYEYRGVEFKYIGNLLDSRKG